MQSASHKTSKNGAEIQCQCLLSLKAYKVLKKTKGGLSLVYLVYLCTLQISCLHAVFNSGEKGSLLKFFYINLRNRVFDSVVLFPLILLYNSSWIWIWMFGQLLVSEELTSSPADGRFCSQKSDFPPSVMLNTVFSKMLMQRVPEWGSRHPPTPTLLEKNKISKINII